MVSNFAVWLSAVWLSALLLSQDTFPSLSVKNETSKAQALARRDPNAEGIDDHPRFHTQAS